MKSKDIALIVMAVILGAIFSGIVSKFVFPSSASSKQVEVVPQLSAEFSTPDARYFNSKSIDLTQFIQIGNSSNPNPFNSNIP
ncbi:hypothetical protein M1512_02925 [Patescibacteria group bacterium]|nr:hypothetical protein [Patescibacteria group bacterium]